MLQDQYGNSLSTQSNAASDGYIEAVDSLLTAADDPQIGLDKVLEADPEFALGHVAQGRHLMLLGDMKGARKSILRAVGLAPGTSVREQSHIEIFNLLSTGRSGDALALTRKHLVDHPRDAFALAPSTSVFGLIGFGGDANREPVQLELLAPLVDVYGDDWWFLTVYAFALIEMGQWQKGRDLVEQALAQKPRSAHTVHIYAHSLYEAGEDKLLADYLQAWLVDYPESMLLSCHAWWHLCISRLMLGEYESVWPIYDAHCAPGATSGPAINVFTDGASLLWRSELAGVERSPARWQALQEYQETTLPKPMVFVDAHGALPSLALGNDDGFSQWLEALQKADEAGRLPAGKIPGEVSRAFAAFEAADWAKAIDILEPIKDQVVRIGGSRAQRDLVLNTLLSAYVKDGRPDAARVIISAQADRSCTVPVAGLV
jgi:tetratricopeptide (TPR) repeat protein